MIEVRVENTFAGWRDTARALLREGVPPEDVIWCEPEQNTLFGAFEESAADDSRVRVPTEFVKIAEAVACYDDPEKWSLLYRLLFRMVNDGRQLLDIDSDADVL